MWPQHAAVRAEPETASPCFSRNEHYVENDRKVNAVREFRNLFSLLVLTRWRNCCIGCQMTVRSFKMQQTG